MLSLPGHVYENSRVSLDQVLLEYEKDSKGLLSQKRARLLEVKEADRETAQLRRQAT